MYEYGSGYGPSYYYYGPRQNYHMVWTPSKVELNRQLRSLWQEHIYWTRLTINSIVGRLPDEKATTARLLRNATDFAAAFQPFYGQQIANRIGELLRAHLILAAQLTTALRDGKTREGEDIQRRWFANADEIADALARINPYWSREEWRNMMYEHLRLTTKEVSTRIAKNYKENVATNDLIEPEAMQMADVMTSGIVQQFPGSFMN